jgi:hypothetical protein
VVIVFFVSSFHKTFFQNPLHQASAEDRARKERAMLPKLSSRKRDVCCVAGIDRVTNYDEQTVNEIIVLLGHFSFVSGHRTTVLHAKIREDQWVECLQQRVMKLVEIENMKAVLVLF